MQRGRIALATAVLALALPAPASAWTVHVTVGAQVVEWQSPQRFARNDFVRLRVFAGAHEIQAIDAGNCRSTLYGMGLVIRASSCGPHLKLRFASARHLPIRLRIHYYRT